MSGCFIHTVIRFFLCCIIFVSFLNYFHNSIILFQQVKILTCTLASLRSRRMANSSRVNTSGYWVFSKARSNWWSWYVVKVVRLRRILRGLFISSSASCKSLPVSPIPPRASSPPWSLSSSPDVVEPLSNRPESASKT